MIGRDEIRWGYLAILGREPEDEAAYDAHKDHDDFETLRQILITSEEGRFKLYRELNKSDHAFSYFASVIVFLHIPKTGGTSLHHWLCQMLEVPYQQISSEVFVQHYSLGELNKMRFVSGHLSYQEAMALPRAEKTLIASFRNPIDRLISLYRFYRAHPIIEGGSDLLPLARSLTPEEFFAHPTVRKSHECNNLYLRVLVDGSFDLDAEGENRSDCLKLALTRVEQLDAVVVCEKMEESAKQLSAYLGIASGSVPNRMQSTDRLAGFDAVPAVVKSATLLETMGDLVEYDARIYDAALRKMSSH